MPIRVLILQSDPVVARTLARFFSERGDVVSQTAHPEKATEFLEKNHPDLVLVDLHQPGNEWLAFLRQLKRTYPDAQVIVTNKYPDFQRELLAREQGVRVFLRQPFTKQWIQAAIDRMDRDKQEGQAYPSVKQPKVKIPVRLKITLPYALLALLFAMAGAYLVSRVILESVEERFDTQLVETGMQTADWMVQEETRLLSALRLISNTQGVSDAVRGGDSETLRSVILPLAINTREEAVEILDAQGTSVLSMRHRTGGSLEEYDADRGETLFKDWDFVQYVLQRRTDSNQDKTAGLAQAPWGNYFYVSGPILAADGSLAGVILVGKSVNSMVRAMREDSLAEVTLYNFDGALLGSTLYENLQAAPVDAPVAAPLLTNVLSSQDKDSLTRDIQVASNKYTELLGPWEVRNRQDIGVMGVSLAQIPLSSSTRVSRLEVFILVSVGFVLVIMVGILLANQITRPLLNVVRAANEVAHGNLEVKVDSKGNDEVAVLAHSFNNMVAGLQEGSIYRDLLGRTVSPEVREQLRQTFTSGNVRLEGQEAVAAVLMSDIRGFTALSEKVDPATIFHWLNEYYSEIVPIITANNGVVNKFDGDAMLAFFGILPRTLNPAQSAYFACRAALEMMAVIDRLNVRRVERGEPPLSTGIGINTGMVTAGGLGTSDRLHYTIIGDTVNTAQRIELLTRELYTSSTALISQSTQTALENQASEFSLDPLGSYVVKGKTDRLMVYRLMPGLEEEKPVMEAAAG